VDRWDASVVRLIADNDLTYHHNVEVTFTEVAWVSSADLFHHPVFRQPPPAERDFCPPTRRRRRMARLSPGMPRRQRRPFP
jgi:hypothetical protein